MALIVEDGSIVADADSYNSEAELRDYATRRGVTLPVNDAELTVLAIKAMDFVESNEYRFKGERVDAAQSLSWPRSGVVINGFTIAKEAIPKQVKDLQCQLTIDAMTVALQPNGTGRVVTKQKVDVIETEYQIIGDGSVELTKANNLLALLVDEGSTGLTVAVLRV